MYCTCSKHLSMWSSLYVYMGWKSETKYNNYDMLLHYDFTSRLPHRNDAKIGKICILWTFWLAIYLINHLFKIQKRAFLPNAPYMKKKYGHRPKWLLFLHHSYGVTLICNNVIIYQNVLKPVTFIYDTSHGIQWWQHYGIQQQWKKGALQPGSSREALQ